MRIFVLALASLLFSSLGFAQARPVDIEQKTDVAMAVTKFAPRKIPSVKVHDGLLKLDSYSWRVYPEIYQSTGRDQKRAVLAIELRGPLDGGFTLAPLVLNLNGRTVTVPVEWIRQNTIAGEDVVSAEIPMEDPRSLKAIADARDVFLTVEVPGSAYKYSVHLTPAAQAPFGPMLAKFDELDPK